MCKTNQFPFMPFESCNKRPQCFSRKKRFHRSRKKFTLSMMLSPRYQTYFPRWDEDMSDVGRKLPKLQMLNMFSLCLAGYVSGHNPVDKSLSSGANVLQSMLLASFPHNPILKFDICFYSLNKVRTIVKILHTFYLPDSELSSG